MREYPIDFVNQTQTKGIFMKQFQDFGLPSLLNEALERMEYKEPTPIQAQTIPLALIGRDILGSAQTGTGKTAAFMLPLIAQLLKDTQKTALVLAPTRELAAQVVTFTQKLLGRKSSIETALLIGGEPMYPQLAMLRKKPRIVIGTPGRVNDHIMRETLSLSKTGIFVLDEADRMLDMGFGVQIDAIAEHLPTTRQTFLFSATLPTAIVRLTQKYLREPEHININASQAPAANLQQDTIAVTSEGKFTELVKELDNRTGSIIIFVKTKFGTEKLARNLRDENHSTDFLHGDLRQNRRSKVIRDFRDRKYRILIATDVAARGLDIPHVEHVINYDLPQCPEDYIHRIGRTARAGAKGSSLCLIAPQDRRLWAAIQHMLDPKKHQKPAPERSSRGGRRGGFGGGGSRGGNNRSSFFARRDNRNDRGDRGDSRADRSERYDKAGTDRGGDTYNRADRGDRDTRDRENRFSGGAERDRNQERSNGYSNNNNRSNGYKRESSTESNGRNKSYSNSNGNGNGNGPSKPYHQNRDTSSNGGYKRSKPSQPRDFDFKQGNRNSGRDRINTPRD